MDQKLYCLHPECRSVHSEKQYTEIGLKVHQSRKHKEELEHYTDLPAVRTTRGQTSTYEDFYVLLSDSDSDSDSKEDGLASSNYDLSPLDNTEIDAKTMLRWQKMMRALF